jgi:phospholipid/cholesterol/gamma-HCH transport system substrate-binding protein
MASKKTKFTVGLFVASGIGFALLAIIWLGMSRFLEKGQYYVTYFNESVQGLDVESPVKYRGVSIGRVQSISVAPDSKLIQVVLKIESGQTLDSDLVAQLKVVGITGSMFVELDRKKKDEPDRSPPLSFPSEYPIVASRPSEISELVRGIDDVINQIRSVDLEGISEKIKLNLDNINQMIDDANVKGISKNIESSLERVSNILDSRRWNKIVASVENTMVGVEGIVADNQKTIKTAVEDFGQAMEEANTLLEKGSSLVSGTADSHSHLRRHLLLIAQNLEKASENLQRLVDLLADHPSQLMFGQPPLPRKVEPEAYER